MAQVWAAGFPLDTIAAVTDLTYSTIWGDGIGGCGTATFTVDVDANAHITQLQRGTPIELREGTATFWTGSVSSAPPEAGGINVTALGWGATGAGLPALEGDAPTTHTTAAVQAAIARGIGWRLGSMPAWASLALSTEDPGLLDMATLLGTGSAANAVVPTVRADRFLRFEAEPTAPKWVTQPPVGALGPDDENFVTGVGVQYLSSSGNGATAYYWARDSAAAQKWGSREKLVNISGLGPIPQLQAKFEAEQRLKLAGARLGWTNALQVPLVDITTMRGTPAHPALLQAGDAIRLDGLYDDTGTLRKNSSTVLTIGEVRYTDGAEDIYIAPYRLASRLSDVLADVTESDTLTPA